jgi:Alr-MurF fusion protein
VNYTVETICEIIRGRFLQFIRAAKIADLVLDSRQVYTAGDALFFALKGPRRDGHQFIPELYKQGIRNFIVGKTINTASFPDANFILTDDVLIALQLLAAHHRRQFTIPVIGITGSNGKTIVKEWLYQLLHNDYEIVRSPKSYNSQIGVPLSVWQINAQHALGIFEAGISLPGEMQNLEKIIQPTIGIFTNIGEAHSEGFSGLQQKAEEKLQLFSHADTLIYCSDHEIIDTAVARLIEERKTNPQEKLFSVFNWGKKPSSTLQVTTITKQNASTKIDAVYKTQSISIEIPFTDDASVENAITCWCTLLLLGYDYSVINERMQKLLPVNMRLEFRKGINQCTLINDSYSADLSSLQIALNFLQQQAAGTKKTVILSDFLQTGYTNEALYKEIAELLARHHVNKVIGIGASISRYLQFNEEKMPEVIFYTTVDEFKMHFRSSLFHNETILVKGARVFRFEQVVKLLEQKVHQTVLEINLNALVNNLKEFQQCLQPSTKMMAMVKAFAYGSGGAEIASALQFHKIDYLGVAYADEGVELRTAGIHLPIMVMNTAPDNFDVIIANNLEPVIYSFEILEAFSNYIEAQAIQQYPVHIEIETGMHRLGFDENEWTQLAGRIAHTPFKIQSIFSHLAAGENPSEDEYTLRQFSFFKKACVVLQEKIHYPVLQHISNSAAILRHSQLQLDMVRLGIGLYGIDTTGSNQLKLQPVAALTSTIAQIKKVRAGETVSYNRHGLIKKDSLIATVRIGYADGYPRLLGNGVGYMLVHGKPAPIVGTVCMDMTMIDVTNIQDVNVGDTVTVFGNGLPIQQIAQWAKTISYEIMTGISERVQRVYFEE